MIGKKRSLCVVDRKDSMQSRHGCYTTSIFDAKRRMLVSNHIYHTYIGPHCRAEGMSAATSCIWYEFASVSGLFANWPTSSFASTSIDDVPST